VLEALVLADDEDVLEMDRLAWCSGGVKPSGAVCAWVRALRVKAAMKRIANRKRKLKLVRMGSPSDDTSGSRGRLAHVPAGAAD
jgi:hypothetical protein